MKTWWIFFGLMLHVGITWSFQAEPHFKSAQDNLTPLYFSTSAIAPYVDGRILVGSDRGLFLFDGYRFQSLAPAEPLGNVKVTSLTVDDDGIIWVGSATGLFRIDRNFLWQAIPLRYRDQVLNPYISTVFPEYYKDPNDDLTKDPTNESKKKLWVVSLDGNMLQISPSGLALGISRLSPIPRTIARKFLRDAEGRVWISSTRGLWYSENTQGPMSQDFFSIEKLVPNVPEELTKKVLQSILLGPDKKRLYVLTYDELFELHIESRKIRKIIDLQSIKQTEKILRFKDVVLHRGEYWLGTYGGGIIRGRGDQWTQFSLDLLHTTSQFDNFINALYLDEQENLWLAGDQKGLLYLNLATQDIEHFRSNRKKTGCLKHDEIYAIHKKAGEFWIGTRGGGVYRIAEAENRCQNYSRDPDGNSLGGNRIYGITSQDSIMWFATAGRGVTRFDLNSGDFTHFRRKDPNSGILDNDVLAIENFSGEIWAGTFNGIAVYDPNNGRFENYQNPGARSVLDHRVYALAYDQQTNRIWVGTEGGVQLFDVAARSFLEAHSSAQTLSAIQNGILALHTSNRGELFIGTQNAGLYRLKNGELLAMTQANGLPGNKVARILRDADSNLWVSTDGGIAKINSHAFRVEAVYQAQHGVLYGEVTQSGYYSSEDNALYFGGTNGLIRLPASDLPTGNLRKAPVLEQIRLFNQPLDLTGHLETYTRGQRLNEAQTLTLTHRDSLVDIEFVAPNFTAPRSTQYRFRLHPFQNDWILTDAQSRRATYTRLPAGNYQFEVNASHVNGAWSEHIKSLAVTVLPPWWETWWARTLYVLLLIASIVAIFIYRTRAIRRRARELTETVKSRTAQLNLEKERVENLLEHKNEEFANVSHEFRTPLTLVLGQSKKLITQESDQTKKKALTAIQRNGKLILRMVDQLISLEKYRVHRHRTEVINVKERIDEYAYAFTDLCKDKGLTFNLLENSPAWVSSTPEAFEKMLLNLLSNAVKYTPASGSVSLSSRVNSEGFCQITVTDTGIGIPSNMFEKVFERFQRVSEYSEVAGAGIGLSLVKELAESHGGKIGLQSEEGVGSTFTLSLPCVEEPKEADSQVSMNAGNFASELELVDNSDSTSNEEVIGEQSLASVAGVQSDETCILIVEDNIELRNYVLEFLTPHYRCVTAGDGEQGYQLANELLPDLIISDVMMPKMSGFEMLSQLKTEEKTSHIPLILLTAKGDKASRIKGWKNLADEYLTKPFDPDELLIRVENLLSIRDLLKQRYGEVLKTQGEGAIEQLKSELPKQDIEFLEKLQSSVEENLEDSSFSTAKLAKSLFMSDRQVQRKVKAISGFSPNEYLRIQRLNRGAKLLATDAPIKVIAFDVGFTSVQYFSSCFKAQFGRSPNEYRNQL